STVIMVENIYRQVSSGAHPEMTLKQKILKACLEVEKTMFFATIIMVCAMLPLFTMKGPEGQIFGPMADTYAFALGGALILAMTISPVLCLWFFKDLRPARDNFVTRWLKKTYIWNLNVCLDHRWGALGVCLFVLVFTLGVLPAL